VKNSFSSIKNKIVSRYTIEDEAPSQKKTPDINVLLNRVKIDQKNESRKKVIFTAATSVGVILFGFLVF
tara:strand:- start:503 stop:709 length:207 start_codon:yes stop_codon:yes gene_type:complete